MHIGTLGITLVVMVVVVTMVMVVVLMVLVGMDLERFLGNEIFSSLSVLQMVLGE